MTTSENVEPRQHIKPQKKNSPKKKLQKSKPLTPQQQQQAKKNKFINDEENDPTLSPDEIALKKLIRSLKNEEQERKQMYQEDLALMLLIERSRRAIERPLLKIQETAYASYMRLTENCVAPIPLLFRLQYLRCLSFKFPQQLTLIMRDGGDLANNMYVLQVVPCHGEKEANEIQNQNETLIAKWKSRFSVTLKSSTRHTFQYFADSGMLVECWPVFFNLFEYCPDGLWIFRLVQEFHHAKRPFVELEQRIINGFRDLSSGLASLHAIGLKHLNICVENIYLDTIGTVKIGSTLACKLPFEEQMPLDQVFNHGYVPPEILCQEPATDKADVWMLGSALYHTLLFLQEDQLLVTPKKIFQSKNKIVYMKKIDEILQEIPLSTSDRTRSLLRMLLQPNPKNRPKMNQVFDYFAFTQFATTS
jgi:serine/threonine protein kinase